MELLQTYPGRLKPLARNIFTLILVGDPLSPTSFSLVQMFYKMYSGYYPIRFGESSAQALQLQGGGLNRIFVSLPHHSHLLLHPGHPFMFPPLSLPPLTNTPHTPHTPHTLHLLPQATR